jgi:transglutaminase superfamily protein
MPNPSDDDLLVSIVAGYRLRRRDLPRVPLGRWPASLVWGWRAMRAFDRVGARRAEELLGRVPVPARRPAGRETTAWRVRARLDADRLRAVLTRLSGPRACYGESFALCGGLRRLGHDAEVVVGFERVSFGALTECHAWVEVLGEAVYGPLDVAVLYEEIERHPRAGALSATTSAS